ncbi:hypothetical protein ACIOD1_01110 [Streptomyces sp. NPDC088097]|uniref:hypothetical protein n=1 Tax=Streptomyces sp. NPDC088097 TaxID=3365823 RepID=UPI0038187E3A
MFDALREPGLGAPEGPRGAAEPRGTRGVRVRRRAPRVAGVVAAALLGGAVLAGCGPGGAPARTAAPSSPGSTATPSTGTGTAPTPGVSSARPTGPTDGPTDGATASPPPDSSATLIRVSRSGGYAGATHTLVVRGDGSWTRLDREARPEGTGRLDAASLESLRGALRGADLAHLPRVATGDPKVFDAFGYVFAQDGVEVTRDEPALTPGLRAVLESLPAFTPDR